MSDLQRVRLMLVGCGLVARRHVEYLRDDPRVQWVCLCDPRSESARSLANEFAPMAAVASDYTTALDAHHPDGVILCSPNAAHFEQVCAALERGCHVLCEKPLAIRREHIVDIIARQRASQRIVSVAHQRRYMSVYVTARRELLQNAACYGPVRHVHIYSSEPWSQGIIGTWRNDPTQNLGYCGDAGIHQIDIVQFITGARPLRLQAVSDRRDRQVEIVTRIWAEFEGGVGCAAHYVGDAHFWSEDIHIHCRDADLVLREGRLLRGRHSKLEPITDMEPDGNPASAFVDAILSGGATVSPPEVALPIFAWNEAVSRSLRDGGWVPLAL